MRACELAGCVVMAPAAEMDTRLVPFCCRRTCPAVVPCAFNTMLPPVVPVPDFSVTVPLTAAESPVAIATFPVVPDVTVVPVLMVIAPLLAFAAELVAMATGPDALPFAPAPDAMLIPPLTAPSLFVVNWNCVAEGPDASRMIVPFDVVALNPALVAGVTSKDPNRLHDKISCPF